MRLLRCRRARIIADVVWTVAEPLLLTEATAPAELARYRVTPQLTVIPSGPLPPNPAELLASGRMSALLQQLTGLAENGIVIVDTSLVLAVADPVVLSTKVDGTLVVMDGGERRRRWLRPGGAEAAELHQDLRARHRLERGAIRGHVQERQAVRCCLAMRRDLIAHESEGGGGQIV